MSKKKLHTTPYIILFSLFGGFFLLIGFMVYRAISVPIVPGPMVTGTVTGIDAGRRGIVVKLDEGQVVIVGGKPHPPYLKGRRITLQEMTNGNRKTYRFRGYLEPLHVLPSESNLRQERQ